MRRLSIITILSILLFGCTSYKIINQIHPKVSIIGDTVGLVYKLGDMTVSDTWKDIEEEKIAFLQTQKDLIFILNIDRSEGGFPQFKYYVNGILFYTAKTIIVPDDLLLSQKDKIEGFYLFKLNGKETSEKNKEAIKKELDNVKQEVKEKGVSFEVENRY